MKKFQIVTGIIALITLINGLVCLFMQPFKSVHTNDTVFFGSILFGCAFIALFLWADNQINGTINTGAKNSRAN